MLLSSITLETSPSSSGLTPFCSFVIDMSVLWSFWKCVDKIEQGPCHILQCQFFFLCFLVQNTEYISSEFKFLKRVANRDKSLTFTQLISYACIKFSKGTAE